MWNWLACLLPTLLLLVGAALLHWSPLRTVLQHTFMGVARATWRGAYWLLELSEAQAHSLGKDEFSSLAWDAPLDMSAMRPRLICKPTALSHHLLLHCRTLLRPLPPKPAWPWGEPHLQTLIGLLWPAEGSERVFFTREHILLSDGGIAGLDWVTGYQKVHQRLCSCRLPRCCCGSCGNSSILLVIPNCLGVVTPHLHRLCSLALQHGFCPLVFHRRGMGGCPLATPCFQEFGDPQDLAQVVAYLHFKYPSTTLLAVSEGSGSGLLLSYLGEYGSSSYLTAAACISPVLHGQMWFETPLPTVYRWAALFYRKLQISRYASELRSRMNVEKLLSSRCLREMEELMFSNPCRSTKEAPVHPDDAFRTWENYWERNEPLRDADEVAVPVLCLCSVDDPLMDSASTLSASRLFHESPYFLCVQTTSGGHCGFIQPSRVGEVKGRAGGSLPVWSHESVLEYLGVASDFLSGEETRKKRNRSWRWDPETEQRGMQKVGAPHGSRPRSGTMLARQRKRAMLMAGRRERYFTHQPGQSDLTFDQHFTWSRTYTR